MSNPLKSKAFKTVLKIAIVAAVAYGVGLALAPAATGAAAAPAAATAGGAAGTTSAATIAGSTAPATAGAAAGTATAAAPTAAAAAAPAATTAAAAPAAAAAGTGATGVASGFTSLNPITQFALIQAGGSALAAATAEEPPNQEIERLKHLHGQRATNVSGDAPIPGQGTPALEPGQRPSAMAARAPLLPNRQAGQSSRAEQDPGLLPGQTAVRGGTSKRFDPITRRFV